MRNLHDIREPEPLTDFMRRLEGVALADFQREYSERLRQTRGVLWRLDRQIDRLFMLGVREGEVVLPLSPEEMWEFRASLMGWPAYFTGETAANRYRGWPLAVVR